MTVSRIHPSPHELEPPAGCVGSMALIVRAGISYRQLDYWTRTGLLTPADEQPTPGSGMSRYYTAAEVDKAATLRFLLDAGISLQTCRAVIDELLECGFVRLAPALTIYLPTDP